MHRPPGYQAESNVMLDATFGAKFRDLGLAKLVEPASRTPLSWPAPGFTLPLVTGPVTAVTSLTGPAR
jgi:hypothetical protein